MQFVYHPELVEQAVLLASRNEARECELHECVDQLYAIADLELRDRAFRRAYAEKFATWGLNHALEDVLGALNLPRGIGQCLVVQAGRAKHQQVDLLAKNEAHTLLIQVRAEALLEPGPLRPWLRSELCHVADMLDEQFGYKPDEITGSSWERKLRQDRYMIVWRIYVAGRLKRAGHSSELELSALRTAFAKAFTHHGTAASSAAFDRVVNAQSLTHSELLDWAVAPETLASDAPAGDECAPRLGGGCPLCGFPTHDWYEFRTHHSIDLANRIRNTHPMWNRNQGACRQCAETYASRFEFFHKSDNRREDLGEENVSSNAHEECVAP